MKIYKGVAVALTAAILASGGGITSSLLTAQPAQAASTQPEIDSAIAQILAETNAERAKAGLEPLILDPQMNKVSQAWSEKMAANKSMIHNPSYTNQLPQPWIRVGENVGQGYTQSTIVPAWMASPGHKANILGSFTHIGLGYWVDETGRGWFTQNFGKYEQPVLTTINEPNTTAGKSDITSSWLAKWDEVVKEYKSELYSSTGALLQTKVTTASNVTFTGLEDGTTYTIKTTARVYNALGEVFVSPVKTYNVTTLEDLPTVTAPTNLILTSGESSVGATWNAPTNVYGTLAPYTVKLSLGSTVVKSVQTTDRNFVFSELNSDTDYKVSVTAASTLNAKTVTATASQQQKTLLSSVADVTEVKNLVATADSATSIKATWGAPDRKIGVGLKYVLTLSTAGKPDVTVQTTSTSYSLTNLRSETLYTVKVQSFIASENGKNTLTTTGIKDAATTPINYDGVSVSAPALKPVTVESTKATLGWTAPTNVTGKLVNYTLTVKQQGQADRVFNTTLDYYVVTGLKENTAYTFELEANAASLNGKFFATSALVSSTKTTPYAQSTAIVSPPRALKVTAASFNQVNASWTAPANVVGTITGYKVTIKAGDFLIKTQTVTGLNTSFTGLADSGIYTVEVSAIAASPDKTKTVTSTLISASDVTPAHVDAPNAPTNLKASALTPTEATFTWVAPTGVYGDIVDYTVIVKQTGKADRKFKSSVTGYKVTGLVENSSYTVQVAANVLSRNATLSDTSPVATVGITTPYSVASTVKVAAPSTLAVTPTFNTIKATWTKPAVTGIITQYRVMLKLNGVVVKKYYPTGTAATTVTFSDLKERTGYTVEIRAYAKSRNGLVTAISRTTTKSVTTTATPAASKVTISPMAPMTVASPTRSTVTAAWNKPAYTGILTSYTVTIKQGSTTVKSLSTSSLKTSFTGLKANTAYTVTVKANVKSSNGLYFRSSSTSKTITTKK